MEYVFAVCSNKKMPIDETLQIAGGKTVVDEILQIANQLLFICQLVLHDDKISLWIFADPGTSPVTGTVDFVDAIKEFLLSQ